MTRPAAAVVASVAALAVAAFGAALLHDPYLRLLLVTLFPIVAVLAGAWALVYFVLRRLHE